MPRQLHSIVENSNNLDHVAARGAVHDEMPSAAALAGDMERPKVRQNFITSDAPQHVGAVAERAESFKKRVSVNVGLTGAESLSGIFQDAGEIFLCLNTKANPPAFFCQLASMPEATS